MHHGFRPGRYEVSDVVTPWRRPGIGWRSCSRPDGTSAARRARERGAPWWTEPRASTDTSARGLLLRRAHEQGAAETDPSTQGELHLTVPTTDLEHVVVPSGQN